MANNSNRRNAQAVAAWNRNGGAHDPRNDKRVRLDRIEAAEAADAINDGLCPVCDGAFGDLSVYNFIAGRFCSRECLAAYWKGGAK